MNRYCIRRTAIAACFIAGASMTVPALAAAPIKAVYECTDGTQLTVLFVRSAAKVTMPDGRTARLPQQRSGSGMRYANSRQELRGKGREATWTVGRGAPLACTAKS